MILSGHPHLWDRATILACDRFWLFEVVFFPRDADGRPLFPEEVREKADEFLYQKALRRGLPHEKAREWARKQMVAAGQKKRQAPATRGGKPGKPGRG